MTLIFQNSLELSSMTNLRIKLRDARFSGNNTKIDTQTGDGTTRCSANIMCVCRWVEGVKLQLLVNLKGVVDSNIH